MKSIIKEQLNTLFYIEHKPLANEKEILEAQTLTALRLLLQCSSQPVETDAFQPFSHAFRGYILQPRESQSS